jgi:hypothetical protein
MVQKYVYYVTSATCFGPRDHPQGFAPNNWNDVTEDDREGTNM